MLSRIPDNFRLTFRSWRSLRSVSVAVVAEDTQYTHACSRVSFFSVIFRRTLLRYVSRIFAWMAIGGSQVRNAVVVNVYVLTLWLIRP